MHKNTIFTIETKSSDKLSFLDVLVDKTRSPSIFLFTESLPIPRYTERNVQLNLDPTDKKFHTERNTGS